ncbi:MAG: hypothetical protein ACTS8S_00265 [Giesbergeria sp.]
MSSSSKSKIAQATVRAIKLRIESALVVEGSFSREFWRTVSIQPRMKALAHNASCRKNATVAMPDTQRSVPVRSASSLLAGCSATNATRNQRMARKVCTNASSQCVAVVAAHLEIFRMTSGNNIFMSSTAPTTQAAARNHAITSLSKNVISKNSRIFYRAPLYG